MAQFVDFSEQEKKGKGGGKGTDFLKLEAGKKYKVRLVGSPYQYFQHWEPVICRSPGKDTDGNIVDPLMLKGHKPNERYTIWVLDREDQNKLKLMDFPASLYQIFAEWKTAYNKEPGGKDGPDWFIRIEIPAGGTKRQQKYKAQALDRIALTEEELGRIKAVDIRAKLLEMRKPHTPEEILALIAKASGGAPVQTSAQTAQKTQTAAKEASSLVDSHEVPGGDPMMDF